MSKLIIAIIAAFAVFSFVNADFFSGNDCGDDCRWELNNETGNLTLSGSGNMYDYNRTVYSPWKDQRDYVKDVYIYGLNSIGNYTFYYCRKMVNVTIDNTVKVIGEYAFSNADALTKATLPSNLETVMDMAFYQTAITEVTIPKSVSFIGNGVFTGCKNLPLIDVDPENNNYYSKDGVLFEKDGKTLVQYPCGCENSTYSIPEGVETIAPRAFSFSKVGTVEIPDSVTSVGVYAFASSKLEKTRLPDNLLKIENSTFSSCSSLTEVNIPKSAVEIGSNAFGGCTKLETLEVPEGLQKIGAAAFSTCSKLINFTLPSKIEAISDQMFYSCEKLSKIVIPENVTEIGKQAFYGCKDLEKIVIPNKVTTFGNDTFSKCTKLVSVFYLGSEQIEKEIFKNDNSLTNVCVTTDYTWDIFGGKNVTDTDICKDFKGMFNKCYTADYVDGEFIGHMTQEAEQWMSLTNGCIVFNCDNSTGFGLWSTCNRTDEESKVCINNTCIQNWETNLMGWSISIEFGDVKISDMNVLEFAANISSIAGTSFDATNFGVETDSNSNIINVVVRVNDETAANTMANTLNQAIKEGCQYGILCEAKSVKVHFNEEKKSSSSQSSKMYSSDASSESTTSSSSAKPEKKSALSGSSSIHNAMISFVVAFFVVVELLMM